MSISKSNLKVYIYTNNNNAIRNEVRKNSHRETGGDLFGLLTTSGSAVVHVVLGPGQRCKRTNQFKQDQEYMRRVERCVKEGHKLCRIGEWYSQPHSSSVDQQNIRRNFPAEMSKFLVIIANMNNRNEVSLSPYFFTRKGSRCEEAEFVVLNVNSPFSKDAKILAQIEQGAEGKEFHGGASLTGRSGSNYQGSDSTSPTRLRAVYLGSHQNHQSSSARSSDDGTTSLADHTSFRTGNSLPAGSTSQQQTANSESEKATTKDVALKEVYDCLKNFFGGEGEVEIESGRRSDIQMTFKHDLYYWMVSFPETYPDEPAKLYREYDRDNLSNSSPCDHYYLEKPLTSHVNILLSIKKRCLSSCKTCENISREALTAAQSVPATTPSVPATIQSVPATVVPVATENSKLVDVVKALTNEIQITLPKVVKLVTMAQSDGSYKVQFEHFYKNWILDIPPEFPDKPAEVRQPSHFGDRESEKMMIRNPSNNRREEKPLVSEELIILAIRTNCWCTPCYDYTRKDRNS